MSEVCSICAAPCGSPAELVDHLKTAHKDVEAVELNPEAHPSGFLCAMCGRRFLTAQALAIHNLRPSAAGHYASWPRPARV